MDTAQRTCLDCGAPVTDGPYDLCPLHEKWMHAGECSCHLGSVCTEACGRGKHHNGCPHDIPEGAMTDPMTDYDQAEYEAAEREDEARRERRWHEAEAAAREMFSAYDHAFARPTSQLHFERQMTFLAPLFKQIDCKCPSLEELQILRDFGYEEGVPDLLRVLARALEAK